MIVLPTKLNDKADEIQAKKEKHNIIKYSLVFYTVIAKMRLFVSSALKMLNKYMFQQPLYSWLLLLPYASINSLQR